MLAMACWKIGYGNQSVLLSFIVEVIVVTRFMQQYFTMCPNVGILMLSFFSIIEKEEGVISFYQTMVVCHFSIIEKECWWHGIKQWLCLWQGFCLSRSSLATNDWL
jgi:hypothetical protein